MSDVTRNPSQPRPQGRQIDLLVLVGPSGAGKSTLINELRKDFPASFGYSISHTTRAARPGEVNGVHYHFIDMPTFESRVASNGFMEHAIVHGTCYGTSFQSLKDVLDQDQIVCMDLDIVGGHNVRKLASLGYRSLVVWVCPPTFEVLEQRLRKRNSDPEEKIKTRLQSAVSEWNWKNDNESFFDGIFVNDDLESCYAGFRHFIMSTCFASMGRKAEEEESASALAALAEPPSDASTSPARSEGEAPEANPYASGNSPIQTFATASTSAETSPEALRARMQEASV